MHPSPSSTTDELELQSAIHALSLQIGEAVAQADVHRVQHLSILRHNLLQKACGPDGAVRFSDSQRAELIRESEAWIASLHAHQTRIMAEIERLRTNRNTKRILARAYRTAPSTVSRCFAHRG